MKNSVQSIAEQLQSEQQRLAEVSQKLPVQDRFTYGNWLAQTYYFVCHSTRLLALAASRFKSGEQELHLRFLDHTREERGHEQMALKDLQNLGYSISEFPELSETQAFYQTQYYWIEHIDPLSFFGYILCLEAFAIEGARKIYDEALRLYGPRSSVFLKVHVQEDVGHVRKAIEAVEQMEDDSKRIISQNLRLSASLYGKVYSAITEANRAMPTPIDKKAA